MKAVQVARAGAEFEIVERKTPEPSSGPRAPLPRSRPPRYRGPQKARRSRSGRRGTRRSFGNYCSPPATRSRARDFRASFLRWPVAQRSNPAIHPNTSSTFSTLSTFSTSTVSTAGVPFLKVHQLTVQRVWYGLCSYRQCEGKEVRQHPCVGSAQSTPRTTVLDTSERSRELLLPKRERPTPQPQAA
jgi:hypothetical protein